MRVYECSCGERYFVSRAQPRSYHARTDGPALQSWINWHRDAGHDIEVLTVY